MQTLRLQCGSGSKWLRVPDRTKAGTFVECHGRAVADRDIQPHGVRPHGASPFHRHVQQGATHTMTAALGRHPHLIYMCNRWLLVRQTCPRQAAGLTIHLGNQGEVSSGGGTIRQPGTPVSIGTLALVGIRTAEGVGRFVKGTQAEIPIEAPIVGHEASDGYRMRLRISAFDLNPRARLRRPVMKRGEGAPREQDCPNVMRTANRGQVPDCSLPLYRIPDANDAAGDHLGKDAASPVGAERGLQARGHLVHSFTRRELASDREPRITDDEYSASRVSEPHARQEKIGPAKHRILVHAKFRHALRPCLRLEQRDLPAAAPINTARNALPDDQRRLGGAIHRAAMRSLDPDRLDVPGDGRKASLARPMKSCVAA